MRREEPMDGRKEGLEARKGKFVRVLASSDLYHQSKKTSHQKTRLVIECTVRHLHSLQATRPNPILQKGLWWKTNRWSTQLSTTLPPTISTLPTSFFKGVALGKGQVSTIDFEVKLSKISRRTLVAASNEVMPFGGILGFRP